MSVSDSSANSRNKLLNEYKLRLKSIRLEFMKGSCNSKSWLNVLEKQVDELTEKKGKNENPEKGTNFEKPPLNSDSPKAPVSSYHNSEKVSKKAPPKRKLDSSKKADRRNSRKFSASKKFAPKSARHFPKKPRRSESKDRSYSDSYPKKDTASFSKNLKTYQKSKNFAGAKNTNSRSEWDSPPFPDSKYNRSRADNSFTDSHRKSNFHDSPVHQKPYRHSPSFRSPERSHQGGYDSQNSRYSPTKTSSDSFQGDFRNSSSSSFRAPKRPLSTFSKQSDFTPNVPYNAANFGKNSLYTENLDFGKMPQMDSDRPYQHFKNYDGGSSYNSGGYQGSGNNGNNGDYSNNYGSNQESNYGPNFNREKKHFYDDRNADDAKATNFKPDFRPHSNDFDEKSRPGSYFGKTPLIQSQRGRQNWDARGRFKKRTAQNEWRAAKNERSNWQFEKSGSYGGENQRQFGGSPMPFKNERRLMDRSGPRF